VSAGRLQSRALTTSWAEPGAPGPAAADRGLHRTGRDPDLRLHLVSAWSTPSRPAW